MPRRRGLSEDDRHVWQQLTETVQPLAAPRAPGPSDTGAVDTIVSDAFDPARAQPSPVATPPVAAGFLQHATTPQRPAPGITDIRPGDLHVMDKRTARRLQGGQMTIAARLDLHGLPAATAQAAFERFVITSHTRGHRCVLVITGKGQRSGQDGGVLRRELPRWLNLPHLRPLVLAATPAQPRDGGHGAMYVLLRRMREGALG